MRGNQTLCYNPLSGRQHGKQRWSNSKMVGLLAALLIAGLVSGCGSSYRMSNEEAKALAETKAFLEQGGDINAIVLPDYKQTRLHIAARAGHKVLVEFLISRGANLNAEDSSNATPLYGALLSDQIPVVELLIERGADVNAGDSPLHFLSEDEEHLLKLLISKGADINAQSGFLEGAPLHHAAEDGHNRNIEILIAHGANINAKNECGWTPLYVAGANQQMQTVRLLLAKGASMDLFTACCLGDIEYIRKNLKESDLRKVQQLEKGDSVTNPRTLLHVAAEYGRLEVARLLLARGADVNARTMEYGSTPLDLAAREGHKDMVVLLVANGADVNAVSKDGETALWWAVQEEHLDIIELLLDKGARGDVRSPLYKRPMLHWTSYFGCLSVVKVLVERGADVNMRDEDGKTPLHEAASGCFRIIGARRDDPQHYVGVVRLLIAKGADVNALDEAGYTPLDRVRSVLRLLQPEPEAVAELLVRHGGKGGPKHPVGIEDTPLHSAAEDGYNRSIEIPIGRGANINAEKEGGWTPLHVAVENGRLEHFQFLSSAL